MQLHLLSIDIETTGLNPNEDQIIELAMVYQAPNGIRVFKSWLVDHERFIGDPFALAMNVAILREIADLRKLPETHHRLTSPFDLATEMVNWLNTIELPPNVKFTPTGKNVGSFDLAFIRNLPGYDLNRSSMRMHHRCLDPGPLFLHDDDVSLPDLKECAIRAKVPTQVHHRALDDALMVLDIINARRDNDSVQES